MTDPLEHTPIDVHGTPAWVLITRDQPLAALSMSYREAEKLHEDLGKYYGSGIKGGKVASL